MLLNSSHGKGDPTGVRFFKKKKKNAHLSLLITHCGYYTLL